MCSTIDKGRTSFQEQAVAYYAKKYFSKAVIGDKKAIGKELDIYIPSIRAAIEYDGVRYHSDEKRVKNDEEKSEKCNRNGIQLIRIREYGLPEIRNSENIIRENNREHATLDAAIRQCLEMLGVSEPNIDTQKDSKDIYRQYKDYKAERSMGGRHPELLKEWDYELNVGIDPLMVSSSSSEVVHWICSRCGHKWEAPINGRAKENAACPVCTTGKRRRNEKSNLATEHPEIAAEWNYEKNKNLKPEYFSSGSAEKCWWTCKNGHSYQMTIASRVYGHDCPECYKQKHFKSVVCVETKEKFSTAKEASIKYRISGGSPILNCCNKLRTVAGGYHWLFANEYESMTEEEVDNFLKANPSRDKFVKKGRTYDLTNMHFGKLKVIERAGSQNGHARWKCQCDCGNKTIVSTNNLLRGHSKSCGCYKRDVARERVSVNLLGQTFGYLTVEEKIVNVLSPFTADVGIVPQSHAIGHGGRNGQPRIGQHFHQHPAAVGNSVENIDLSAIMLHQIIAQPFGFVHGRLKLRFRLVGIETVRPPALRGSFSPAPSLTAAYRGS